MSKKLVAALLALFMLAGLVACSGKPAEAPKTEEAPKAEEAPKTEEAPKAEEAPKTEEVKITDGVWTCASDATHFALVKFKEDGTFYARGLMGQKGCFGKYEVVDQAVEYYDAHEDGTINVYDPTSVEVSSHPWSAATISSYSSSIHVLQLSEAAQQADDNADDGESEGNGEG